MMDETLPTATWVQAGLALCSGRGVPAAVLNKGDPHTGVVLVKIATLDGFCRLLTQQRDLTGRLRWVDALPDQDRPSDADADSYMRRAHHRDPDLWMIEIEDRHARNPFDPT